MNLVHVVIVVLIVVNRLAISVFLARPRLAKPRDEADQNSRHVTDPGETSMPNRIARETEAGRENKDAKS